MAVIDGLVSYFSLEEASGMRVDAHGSNDLTDNDTVGSASGKVGTAADFEADNSESLSHAGINVTDAVTVSLWFNQESQPAGYIGLFSRDGDLGAGRRQVTLYVNPLQKLAAYLNGGAQGAIDGSGATTFSTATWYHVAITFDASAGLIAYVNGEVEGSINLLTGPLGSGAVAVSLGNDIGSGGRYFDGLIDEVGLWERALTSTEITWLYNSGAGRSYAEFSPAANAGPLVNAALVKSLVGQGLVN